MKMIHCIVLINYNITAFYNFTDVYNKDERDEGDKSDLSDFMEVFPWGNGCASDFHMLTAVYILLPMPRQTCTTRQLKMNWDSPVSRSKFELSLVSAIACPTWAGLDHPANPWRRDPILGP
jgi:hypothetical protein